MPADPIKRPSSLWGAFSHRPFAVMWFATTCSLTGLAISDTASAWLMTTLNADPRAVSLVQVTSSLPMFLLTLPAGALADMAPTRAYLIILETFVVILMGLFGAVIFFHWATPVALLATIFVLGLAWSLAAPAWLSLTPLLVPQRDLAGANAANSVGYNVSRAIGPAIAGFAIAKLGSAAPYWIFGVADLASIGALIWWRPPAKAASDIRHEGLPSALRIGFRHAIQNRSLRATIVRTVAVYPFASAYLALLPLVARHETAGPELYGVLLAFISVGAVLGSLALGWMQGRFDADHVVAFGTGGLAIALVLFGLARNPTASVAAALVAGASWTIILAALYVAAQVALPDWVRGRGLAIFLTAIFGSVTLGSAVWGQVAATAGLHLAFFAAAAGALLAIPLTWRWKLGRSATHDLPSPAPMRPAITGRDGAPGLAAPEGS